MKIFGTDYDGVIINIEHQKAVAFGDLLNKEWSVNKNDAASLWIATGGTSRRYKFDYYYRKQFNKNLTDDEYKIIEKKFSNLLKNEYYPKIELLPGALELLKYAKNNFDFTFISSGIPMDELKYLVSLNRLSDYFNLILGTNKIFKTKNEHFQKIINDKNPNLIIFVADGPTDMKVVKALDIVQSIGITTNHSKEELVSAGAKNVVDDLSEVLTLIKSLL